MINRDYIQIQVLQPFLLPKSFEKQNVGACQAASLAQLSRHKVILRGGINQKQIHTIVTSLYIVKKFQHSSDYPILINIFRI